MNCTTRCEKELVNKTWLDVEVQYFKFIGRIPCSSHEYNICNTSRSMGHEGGAGVPGEFQQQSDSAPEEPRSGTGDTTSPLLTREMRERAAGAQERELAGALTDAGSGTLMSRWCPCCLPIEPGPRGQKARKQPCLHQSAQFQPDIYHTADR